MTVIAVGAAHNTKSLGSYASTGQCDVATVHGTLRADTAFVVPRDPMRIVCTGDWVAVDPDGDPSAPDHSPQPGTRHE